MDPATAALIGGGLSAVSGIMGAKAQKSASKEMADALALQALMQKQIYEQTREDLAPFRDVAGEALEFLPGAAGDTESPLYQFRLAEQMKQLNAALSARGLYGSGAGLELIGQETRTMTAEEAEARWRRNMELANLGFGGASQTAQAGQAYGSQIAQPVSQIGQAGQNLSNLYGGTAAGLNQALQGGLQNQYFQNYLTQIQPSPYTTGTYGSGGGAQIAPYTP